MGEVVQFRTKRLTGFILESDQETEQPEQKQAEQDTAPSEFCAPDGDCG